MNIIGKYINLARAYEVALLGGHTITLWYSEDYKGAEQDVKLIKKFYKDIIFAEKGDINIEICKPNYEKGEEVTYETLKNIHERVNKTQGNETPTKLTSTSETLLKTAVERLDLSLTQTENLKKVAGTISKLHGVKEIMPEHIAEAIHYSSVDEELINAELHNFGGIIVPKNISKENIEKTIEYLKKLI